MWTRSCPWCGAQLKKIDPQDLFRCTCGWEEKLMPWQKRKP